MGFSVTLTLNIRKQQEIVAYIVLVSNSLGSYTSGLRKHRYKCLVRLSFTVLVLFHHRQLASDTRTFMLFRKRSGGLGTPLAFCIDCPVCWSTQRRSTHWDAATSLLDKPRWCHIDIPRGSQSCQSMACYYPDTTGNLGAEEGKSADYDVTRKRQQKKDPCRSPIRS